MPKTTVDLHIPDNILQIWQEFLNVLSEVLAIPAALIMRLEQPYIQVFVSSKGKDNPYHPGEREIFDQSGLYCEHVIKSGSKLLVPNALQDQNWDHNPDIKLNMISYLGYPIFKPDGEAFGTLCVLDNKENSYSPRAEKILEHYRNLIQHELAIEYLNSHLGQENAGLNDYVNDLLDKNRIISEQSEQLREVNDQLNSKIEVLDWLVKVISHDIRGPLGSFQKLLRMMEDGSIPQDEYPQLIQALHRQSGQLFNIVDEMLDGIRIQNSDLAEYASLDNHDLTPILESLYHLYHFIATQKRIELDLEMDSGPVLARINPKLLKVAIRNLLNNAMKFSPEKAKVRLRLRNLEPGAEISVIDTGVGLSDGMLSYLRGDMSVSAPEDGNPLNKGYGFGLGLCKDCVQRMQGILEISGEPAKGATFTIILPN